LSKEIAHGLAEFFSDCPKQGICFLPDIKLKCQLAPDDSRIFHDVVLAVNG
jgi:hypothetical protein